MSEHRSLLLNVTRADEDDNLVTFPLSSEEPYRRYDGVEILDHSSESVDLTWLNSGNAPLLDTHSMYGLSDQLGVIRKAWIEDKRIYVSVEFGYDQKAQDVAANVKANIIRNVSVGYERIKIDEKNEETDEYRVSRWRPYEASFVPLPADRTVGMGRSAKPKEGNMPNTAENTALPPMTDEMRAQAIVDANAEITALAQAHNMSDVARSFINGAMAKAEIPNVNLFKGIVVSELPEGTPLVNTDIGLTDKEKREFSVLRLARTLDAGDDSAEARAAAAFELEAVGEAGVARNGGLVIPSDILGSWNDFTIDGQSSRSFGARATMVTGDNPNILTVDHMASAFIDNLRNTLVLGRSGIMMLPGLTDDVEIPGKDANSSATWLSAENDETTETTPTFRKIALAPHDVGGHTHFGRRMLRQSTIGLEALARQDLVTAIAESIDLAGFYGTGASGQPTGLSNTTGIGSVTFAAAVPTRNELLDMKKSIAASNQTSSPLYVMDTDMDVDLRKTVVDAGSGRFLVDNSGNLEIGYGTALTNQLTSGDIFAGVFSDMVMGLWGGLEIKRSTEHQLLRHGVTITAIQTVDFGVRRVNSFVLGNDGV